MAKVKYKPGKDGIYRTRAWDGTYNPNGTKHRVNLKSEKSSGDLEKQVVALKRQVEDGAIVQPTDIAFCDYAEEWLETYKAVRSQNTRAMYQNIIDHHLSYFGNLRLREIRRMHLQLLINNAIDKPRTCQQIVLTVKQIIKCAVADKYLPSGAVDDICLGVEAPRYKAAEKRPLTLAEVAALKRADFTPMEKTFVLILYCCGVRRGEALALTRLNIDLKRSILTVRQSVEFVGNNPRLKDTKSQNGRRSLPILPFLRVQLADYLQSLEGDYLFQTRGGKMTKSSYRKMWGRIIKKMNLAAGGKDGLQVIHGLTAHTFRHNYCTNLCYQVPKISTKKIAALMGDTEAMVLNVYSHIAEEKEDVEGAVRAAIAL